MIRPHIERATRRYNANGMHVIAAELVTADVHAGQVDKHGVDYHDGHLRAVASLAHEHGTLAETVAWLHDSVEDTDMTFHGLHELGFPFVVIEAVAALTHRDGEPYDVYLDRIARAGHTARVVKLADMTHNLDESRGPLLASKADIYRAGIAKLTLVENDARATLGV